MKAPRKTKKAGASQSCPICGKAQRLNPRYPRHLCDECVRQVTDEKGRPLEFFNEGFSGGFEARYVDTKKVRDSHVCFIRRTRCWADEAYFGGIVIETQTLRQFQEVERERQARRTRSKRLSEGR